MQISEVYRPQLLTCQAADLLPTVAQKMAAEQVGSWPRVILGGKSPR